MFEYSHGAIVTRDGTRFRLWAPNASRVDVMVDDAPATSLKEAGDGYFEVTLPVPAGATYRYRIDDAQDVPDPASRLQDGDVHDPSVVCASDAYVWRNPDWKGRPWHEVVLYEVHPGTAGGYAGIEARLAALANLGVTAIELMPIADFPGQHNWGYDGVLPYAPDGAYGTPDELRRLIDTAHGLGMMVFLDVVYNHFGPDGNYLSIYASDFFDASQQTPWGAAIDFSRQPVRRFFAENALYWLTEFRFDGLRFDAVHAISDTTWLTEMARFVRTQIGTDRYVHLVLENEDNNATLLEEGFDAQWNDDAHHVFHHLLTGETRAYYADFSKDAGAKLARAISQGFVYQGEASAVHGNHPRGQPSDHLPPTAFVLFLQNHDQVGNRAFGERLTTLTRETPDALAAAIALQLLTPQIPLLFMGEERGEQAPFLYFTSHSDPELARAVRDGRRREFAGFNDFSDPADLARIPDPNAASTFEHSLDRTPIDNPEAARWTLLYKTLLDIRQQRIQSGLPGAASMGARNVGPAAIVARWRLGNGKILTIYANLNGEQATGEQLSDDYDPLAEVIYESRPGTDAQLRAVCLPPYSVVALLKHE